MKVVLAYTDGSAVGHGKNKGKGGFGAYFPDLNGERKAYSLGYRWTKTGEMEVTALYYAIAAMPLHSDEKIILRVFSDSEYVVKSFTEKRLEKWIQNGWRNSSGEVANKQLWKAIIKELNERKYLILRMNHIRSHQVEKAKTQEEKDKLMENPHIIGNMIADRLADYKRFDTLLEESPIPK